MNIGNIEITENDIYWALGALCLVYEYVARKIPAEGNWTILHNVMRVIDYFVKNRSTNNTEFTVAKVQIPTEEKKDLVV
jgi:hypothetical protein